MLKRTKILVAFLAVTVVCAAVGFAAVQDELNAEASLALDLSSDGELGQEFDADVYFSAAEVSTNAEKTTAASSGVTVTPTTSTNADTLNITIDDTTFTAVGQKVTIIATITNASTVQEVTLGTPTISNTDMQDFVSVTATAASNTISTGSNNTTTLEIVVTLTQVPNAETVSGNFSISIIATPVVATAA